ncbi:MAG: Gfo/Idh/MocA family oxidoreductase [Lentisphaeria bacterium]|nr:Gfo/Idh/MocA family oxidoreductase [Lentisphaeria bacterium]
MKKRIGIIGFGEMGKRHALEFRESTMGEIAIAGVVEPNDEMYENGCAWNKCDIPRYGSVEELLEKGAPDGILITSPNFTHLANLKKLDSFHGPILVEKPLDTSPEKISDIVRFVKQHKGPVMVDHCMRYSPIIRKARELIEKGAIGKVCSFQFTQRDGAGMYHNFRRTRAGGGGFMVEKATHDLDVMLFFTDARPESVMMVSAQHAVGGDKPDDLTCSECAERGRCRYAKESYVMKGLKVNDVAKLNELCVFAKCVDVPDNETCTIRLSNGIFGTYSHSYFVPVPGHSRIYEILGTEGAMYLTLSREGSYEGEIKIYPFNRELTTETLSFKYDGKIHYYAGPFLARHFLSLMKGETTPFTTVPQAFTAEMLGFAAIRSSMEGSRWVELSEIVPRDLADSIVGK